MASGTGFVLVGRHLAVLIEVVRRLGEVTVVVVERGERSVDRLTTLVETAVQVAVTTAAIAGDGGLHSLEATGASASGDLWECRELDREAKVYSTQLCGSPRAMKEWRQIVDVGQWGFVTILVDFVEGLRDVVTEFCTHDGSQEHDTNDYTGRLHS